MHSDRRTQRPTFSKHVRSVSNSFLWAFKACLVNLELPFNLFIASDVLRELWSFRKF